MDDVEVFALSQHPNIIAKTMVEMIKAANWVRADGATTPNNKAFALEAIINSDAWFRKFIWFVVTDANVQAGGSDGGAADAVVGGVIAAAWPVLWA